jgi:phosphohistidine phosphatase SixA
VARSLKCGARPEINALPGNPAFPVRAHRRMKGANRIPGVLPMPIRRLAALALLALPAMAAAQQPAPQPAPPMMGPAAAPLPRKQPAAQLAALLRQGGYVVLMRHTNSPNAIPDAASAAPGNTAPERQLDAQGHADATAFGAAIRRLGLRFAQVWSSPTFRARQVVADAGFPASETPVFLDVPVPQAREASAAALSALLRQAPPAGTNVLVITHFPNVSAVLGPEGRGLGEGDAAVIKPEGDHFTLVGAFAIADWPALGR